MSAGDAREGIIRGRASRARLGGKLAGLSLPRQIAVIAFWPFLEQLLSFFVTSSDLFIATKIGVDAQDTINISDGMGAVVFLMWIRLCDQGSIMMGATAIVSGMTGARDYSQAQHGLHQAAMLGLLAGIISCGLLFACSGFLVTHVLTMNEAAREYALQYVYVAAFAAPFSGVVFAVNAALRGSGDTRLPFWIMMNVGILNVIFSVLFVFAEAPAGRLAHRRHRGGNGLRLRYQHVPASLHHAAAAGKKSSRNIPVCPWKNWSGKRENTMRRLCTSPSPILRPDMACRSAS